MAHRTGATVDVDLGVRQIQVFHRGHGHHRKRLVNFVEVDIVRIPAEALVQLVDRTDRGGGEPFRLVGVRGVADNARDRLEALG